MRSRSGKVSNHPTIIYDADQDLSHKCAICFQADPPKLISPCQCSLLYHQTCLLRYIRQKLLSMKKQLDFSRLRCKTCKQQLKCLYHENTHYSCTHFCNKQRTNCWSKSLVFIILNLIAIVAVAVILRSHSEGIVHMGLLIGLSVLCLFLVVGIAVFVHTNLMYKQIVLVKVYQFVEYRNNTSSSDESPPNNNYDEVQIVINQTY